MFITGQDHKGGQETKLLTEGNGIAIVRTSSCAAQRISNIKEAENVDDNDSNC